MSDATDPRGYWASQSPVTAPGEPAAKRLTSFPLS
jgi:hypothetical protein